MARKWICLWGRWLQVLGVTIGSLCSHSKVGHEVIFRALQGRKEHYFRGCFLCARS